MRWPTHLADGKKISIDSATMANKALEVIEASYLFGFQGDAIEVVIHPQSIIHSMIRTRDGAVYAQLGNPDMSLPIINALTSMSSNLVSPLDFIHLMLTFEAIDEKRFPLLRCGYDALSGQGGYPLAFNAANEVAVEAFLSERITYPRLIHTVQRTLDHDWTFTPKSVEEIIALDSEVRFKAKELMSYFLAQVIKYLIGIVGITVVVLIHELGHLVAARICGIDVEVFSFGFGPRLIGKHIGDLDLRLSLFPVGGYCRLKGSDDVRQSLRNEQSLFLEEGSIFAASPIRRIITYLAGPVASFLLSRLIYTKLSLMPYEVLYTEAIVTTVNDYPELFGPEATSPAYDAGIRSGDRASPSTGKQLMTGKH